MILYYTVYTSEWGFDESQKATPPFMMLAWRVNHGDVAGWQIFKLVPACDPRLCGIGQAPRATDIATMYIIYI